MVKIQPRTMAKRGRKPKERKGYFYEKEETAIIQYIHEENTEEKNRIFNTVIYPALTKMIESIIRRYKLFIPDEDFSQNFNDTISYLLTKIHHFKPQITGYDLIENEKEIEILNLLKEKDVLRKEINSPSLRKLIENNVVVLKSVEVNRNIDFVKEEKKNIELTPEQNEAYTKIKNSTNSSLPNVARTEERRKKK